MLELLEIVTYVETHEFEDETSQIDAEIRLHVADRFCGVPTDPTRRNGLNGKNYERYLTSLNI